MFYSPETLASARESLGDLWPLLRTGLWHATLPERYRAIIDDGEIRPDGGRGGNVYGGSLALSMGAVSLFDFESASEEDALGTYGKWSAHLWPGIETRLTVWIGLDRALLPGNFIPSEECRERATRERKNYYPRVEACHIGLVPANAFTDTFAVSTWTSPRKFERLPVGSAGLRRLDELAEVWPDPPDAEIVRILSARRDRIARGEE